MRHDLEDIAIGGAILGTGGGGDPYVGKLMAQQAIKKHGPVRLVDVDEMDDDALIVPVCMMGAPTVMTEKLPQGDELMTPSAPSSSCSAADRRACSAARRAASTRRRRSSSRRPAGCR